MRISKICYGAVTMIWPSKIACGKEVTFLLLYTLITALASISIGSSLGYSSIALPVLTSNRTRITLTETEVPLFASLPMISQIFGSFGSGLTMQYGRRLAIVVGSLVCAVGWVIIALSHTTVPLFIGRILTGLATGLCSAPTAVYIGEISSTRWRGAFTCSGSLFISIGIVLVYLLGFLMRDNWPGVAAICVIFPAASVICTIAFLPESPLWLLTKGREQDARTSLFRIRGLKYETTKFQEEFADMVNYIESTRTCRGDEEPFETAGKIQLGVELRKKCKVLLNVLRFPEVWKPLAVLTCFFFFQQFSGIYVMISYAVDMIVTSGITVDPFLVTVLVGVIQVLSIIVNIFCGTKIGQRTSSIWSGIGMSISLGLLALNNQLSGIYYDVPGLSLACVIIFVASGAFGFLILPWAMIGELYPAQYVNVLSPLTTCLASIFNFTILQVYPAMVNYDVNFPIYFYCSMCITATLFVTLFLPETLGKTKLEIEEAFKMRYFGG